MKKIIFISFVFLAVMGFGQSTTGKGGVDKPATESAVEILNEANKIAETNATKSMELATTALEKSIKQKDKTTEYFSYNTLGTLYYNIGNYSKAISYFTMAKNGFVTINNEKGMKYSEKYLALALEKQKKYAEALKVKEEADKRSSYKNKGDYQKGKYDKARLKSKSGKKEEAMSDLETLSKEEKVTPETKIDIYNELGDLYAEKMDTVKAYNWYVKTLELEKSAETRSIISTTNKSGYLDAAKKVSELNLKGNRMVENITIQNQLLLDGLKSKDLDLVQTANFNIGSTYMQQRNEVKAIPFLFASAKIAKSRNNPVEEQKSVKELATAYENLGQYDKALDIYKRYVRLSDSFKSLQAGNEEASLALNREFLKQEQRIKGLMTSQKEKEASIKRQRNIVW
ncbi:MAG: tetratricopeptide repeat protein, partial [Bacteroidia bacterium]